MRKLPQTLVKAKNSLNAQSPWLLTLVIDTGTPDEPIRLVQNTEDLSFNGNIYTAFPFQIDAQVVTSSGEIPQLDIRVSNVAKIFHSTFEAVKGGVGTSLTLTVVNVSHPEENYEELSVSYDVLESKADHQWITFRVGAPNPLMQRFPLDIFLGHHCNWAYKSAECAAVSPLTTCNQTFSDCEARNNTSRFGGFVGLRRGSIKIT